MGELFIQSLYAKALLIKIQVKIIQKTDIILFIRDNQRENFINNNTEIPGWFQLAEKNTDINEKKIILCLNKTDLITDEKEYKSKQEELKNNVLTQFQI